MKESIDPTTMLSTDPPEWEENEKNWETVFTENDDGSFTINSSDNRKIKPVFPESKTQKLIADGNTEVLQAGELEDDPIYPMPVFELTEQDSIGINAVEEGNICIKESGGNDIDFPGEVDPNTKLLILKMVGSAIASMSNEDVNAAQFSVYSTRKFTGYEDWHLDSKNEHMLSRVIVSNTQPTKFATIASPDGDELPFRAVSIENKFRACPGVAYLFHVKQPHTAPSFNMSDLRNQQIGKLNAAGVEIDYEKQFPRKVIILTVTFLKEEV